jgi:hypothetical protein
MGLLVDLRGGCDGGDAHVITAAFVARISRLKTLHTLHMFAFAAA